MQRSKVLAVVAALVSAGTVAILFAGGASAASWHVYKGDVFPGHAYGLQVPAGAEAVEFLLDGSEATASLAVYAPDGARVGHYALSSELPAASVANPKAGRYVIYVYELDEGALSVRVNSPSQPALDLSQIPLVREEVRVGTFPSGPLNQAITTELAREPVFVTLLYEGSAKGLDATVSSEKGAVVSIVDETATAFSPGVWTSMKGERSFDASKLAGKLYTVEVHADSFEGTMVLTTLALDLAAPKPPAPPRLPRPVAPAPSMPASSAQFALVPGQPVAFEAPAGALLLADPEALGRAAENESRHSHSYDHTHTYAIVSIYAPDDTLLALVELTDEEYAVEVELPVAGEYVAYLRESHSELVLARVAGLSVAPALRVLDVETEVLEFDVGSILLDDDRTAFELSRAPLEMGLALRGTGTLASVVVENEKGVVAHADAPLLLPFRSRIAWSAVYPEHFAAGVHEIATHGAFAGTAELTLTYFLRDVEAPVEEAEPAAEEEEPEEPEEPGQEPAPPMPPMVPPPPVPRVDALPIPRLW